MAWKGWEEFVPQAAPTAPPKAKPSKYRSQPTTVDGLTFASRREAARYQTLLLEQRAGAITSLEVQPQYPLAVMTPAGVAVVIGRYLADFRYQRDGRTVIEDAKGFAGKDLYVWKKRHVEAQYGIEVVEI